MLQAEMLPTLKEMEEHKCSIGSTCFCIVLSDDTFITLAADFGPEEYLDEMARVEIVYRGDTLYKSDSFEDFDKAKRILIDFIEKNSFTVRETYYY